MFKRFSFVLSLPLFLSACAFDESSSSQNLQDLYGTWQYNHETGQSFLLITENGYTHYDHLESHDCYTARELTFLHANNRRLTFEPKDNQEAYLDWSIRDSVLTFTSSDGFTSTLLKSNASPESAPLCSDNADPGALYISISFQSLPDTISLNHQATPDRAQEFHINITFDLNQSGITDVGDIIFGINHIKNEDASPVEKPIEDLFTRAYIITEIDNSSRTTATLTTFEYSITNNKINFHISKSDHVALSSISNRINMKADTYYSDESGGYRFDRFPEFNSFTPEGTDLSNMLDNSDDTSGTSSEPIIVDIQEISIQFID